MLQDHGLVVGANHSVLLLAQKGMDQQKYCEEDGKGLEWAGRARLFKLLSFLDKKLPLYSDIHSFVKAALISADSSYRVYFRSQPRSPSSQANEDDYSVILGIRLEKLDRFHEETRVLCWTLTAWAHDEENVSNLLATIDTIEWGVDLVIMHLKGYNPHPKMTDLIDSIRGVKSNSLPFYSCNQFFMPAQDALSLQLYTLEDVYVQSLERHHAQQLYDLWEYNLTTTVENIGKEIDYFPSAGVFLKETDKLVCWITSHPPSGLGKLHTLEDHRRKGYASLAVRYLCKRLAQSGFIPFLNIPVEDLPSRRFFENVGFKFLRESYIQHM